MNTRHVMVGVLVAGLVSLQSVTANEQGKQETGNTGSAKAAAASGAQQARVAKTKRKAPVYVPPLRGAPLARVGGGTRGVGDQLPVVSVVTPEHTGYTSLPQPRLYWYLSQKMPARIEVALINDHDIDPLMEASLSSEVESGLNRIDLADFDITLKPGVAYQWSVALVPDPDQRSGDVIASGRIQFAELAQEQKARLEQAADEEAVWIFAEQGYWYDAFERLSALIAEQPGNQDLRLQRIALLEQVGLDEVAAFDRAALDATAGAGKD